MRLHLTLVFFVFTSVIYCQKSSLVQNINGRAKELKHDLTKSGDSIIFKCERNIFEIVIFGNDFERVVRVMDNKAKISVADLPVGRYMVEVLLRDKLIVVTLLRNEAFDLPDISSVTTDNSELVDLKKPPKQEHNLAMATKKTIKVAPGKKPRLVRRVVRKSRPKPKPKREVKNGIIKKPITKYWMVYIMNKGTSKVKTLKLGNQNDVDRLINKIEIDKKTKTGRLNELTVWRVYNPSEFLIHKRKNKNDYLKLESNTFNAQPYYEKLNKE